MTVRRVSSCLSIYRVALSRRFAFQVEIVVQILFTIQPCWWQRAKGPQWQRREGPRCQQLMAAAVPAGLADRHTWGAGQQGKQTGYRKKSGMQSSLTARSLW